jgi:hypothetical protein
VRATFSILAAALALFACGEATPSTGSFREPPRTAPPAARTESVAALQSSTVTAAPSVAAPPIVESPLRAIARILTPNSGDSWNPSRLKLTAFKEDAGVVDLTYEARAAEDIAELLQRLAKTPGFSDVRIVTANVDRQRAEVVRGHATAHVTDTEHVRIDSAADVKMVFGDGLRNPFEGDVSAGDLSEVVASGRRLDELKLIGIVTGPSPVAMLVDPGGIGFTVKQGDIVGTSEATGDPHPEACRWRVDGIEAARVSFVRSDPSVCAASPKTRALDLKR